MRLLKYCALFLLFAFLPLPLIIVAISSVSETGYFTVPLNSFSMRWYVEFFTDSEWLRLLLVSGLIAAGVALISTTAALLAALVLHRREFAGNGLFETLIMLPLVFP